MILMSWSDFEGVSTDFHVAMWLEIGRHDHMRFCTLCQLWEKCGAGGAFVTRRGG